MGKIFINRTTITKGSELAFMDGTFTCREYDGKYVWGTLVDLDGAFWVNKRYTLAEIENKMHDVDGHNYIVYWEE